MVEIVSTGIDGFESSEDLEHCMSNIEAMPAASIRAGLVVMFIIW
jgi:hypothetical protein